MKYNITKSLEVHQAYETDTFGNIVRLHRKMLDNTKFEIHSIVKVMNGTNNKSIYAHLRTLNGKYNGENEGEDWIRIDEDLRNDLGDPPIRSKPNFTIEKTGVGVLLRYCLNHSNPVVKYPSWVAVIIGWVSSTIAIISIELAFLL